MSYIEDLAKRKERWKAYNAVAAAKRKGALVPQPCVACGANAEAHHPNYKKPLEIIWVCREHHRVIDSIKIGPKQPRTYESKVGGLPLIIEF